MYAKVHLHIQICFVLFHVSYIPLFGLPDLFSHFFLPVLRSCVVDLLNHIKKDCLSVPRHKKKKKTTKGNPTVDTVNNHKSVFIY